MCFGGSDTPDYTGAAEIQAAGAREGAERNAQVMREMYDQSAAYLAPWRQSGGAANTQLSGLFGLPGYAAVDPTKTLQAFPGYQWGLQQGVNAMDASAASRGLALSGPQRLATNQWGQNYGLTQAWNPYVQQLNTMSQQGLGAAGTTGQYGMATGANIGAGYMSAEQMAANARAQAMIQEQNAKNQQGAGWMQGIGSILGMVGGAALAPFTGGTSLIGAGISGLGGLLGMGGGGGGAGTTGGLGGWDQYGIQSGGNMGMGYSPGMFTSMTPRLADGGPAYNNRSYVVGERGPEVFVPAQDGYVIPNHVLPPAMGGANEFSQFAPWRTA
jgi:hypothetical protein